MMAAVLSLGLALLGGVIRLAQALRLPVPLLYGAFADVKQRLKKYGLFKPTYEGAVPGNPGPAPPVILLYFPARSTGQFHRRNDR